MKLNVEKFTKAVFTLSKINVKGNAKFNFCLLRNIRQLKAIVDDVHKAARAIYPSEVWKDIDAFEKQRSAIMKKYAKLDEAGDFVTNNGFIVFKSDDDFKAFEEEVKPLVERYKDALEEYQKLKPKELEFLRSEIEFESIPYTGSIEELPNELTTKEMQALLDLGIISDC